ncbi:unnamed protein product [Microthlaspi erraticum]|uniref:Acidic protein n=1 Tax=Microthlaspi erraticum TaxID=1685480 RepID=A0A6D2HSZ1_9BRAS|nr:unnamed protein product [Microthlaspi erraticum]CAA7018551.1 unnamed protein product [Microthlaspi erraticum]
MESKTVVLGLLIMSLVMAQTQIEARSCCPTTNARNVYNTCRLGGIPRPTCASLSGCKLIDGNCPPGFLKDNSGDVVNEYCKLGCVSSVCGAITTLQSTDESEIVNGECTKACSTLCTKGSITTRGTA